MKYFKLDESTKNKIIGKAYPQIQGLPAGYDSEDALSIYNYLDNYPDLNETPNLPEFIVEPKAKLTDVMSCAFIYHKSFVVSERFILAMSSFHLPPHKFFKIKLVLNKDTIVENYYWFCFNNDQTSNIDFKNSSFYAIDEFDLSNQVIVNFNDFDDYVRYSKRNYSHIIKPKNLFWHSSFQNEFDIFQVRILVSPIVSEKFATTIKSLNLTGLEPTEITFEWN
jgi:hypothetical protein